MSRSTLSATLLAVCLATAARAASFDAYGQCVGDANGDTAVTVDELVTAVSNALGACDFTPVTLRFRGNVGNEPFACGNTYHGVGMGAADFVPSDFRFYIHNVRLVTPEDVEVPLKLEQDGLWQTQEVALLDFENKQRPCNEGTVQTNTEVHGHVAPGTYTGVRFVLGVPFRLNHADQTLAASPLNLTSLFWSWQDGYKFLRVDTAFDNVRVHLGSTGCVLSRPNKVTTCSHPNRAEIRLSNFDATTNVIVADLGALLADSDLNVNQVDTAPGCQSDPGDLDCVPIFRNLGLNFDDGSPTPGSQKFFRVE